MRCLLAAPLLIAGCGGGADGTPVAPTTPAPAVESAPLPPPQEDVVVPPAEPGKLAPDRIRLTLTSEAGAPLPDAAYAWTTDEHSGWVFPPEGRTDDEGLIDAAWIPGFPGTGKLGLTFTEDGEERTREFETVSVASDNPPWSELVLRLNSPLATGYSIDLTPLTEPPGTYYSAINWSGGYAGLQRRGNLFDRQLQFSAWDASGGTPPEVVEMADGLICRGFDHEGSGVQCGTEYPWAVGKTYRFEMTVEPGAPGYSHLVLHVTDLESGDRRHIGTLQANRQAFDTGFFGFVEDFRRTAPTCLDQQVRSAAFRRALARTETGWVPLTDGTLSTFSREDTANPGTPACVNYDVREHPAGLELLIGGPNVRDPHKSARVRIPE